MIKIDVFGGSGSTAWANYVNDHGTGEDAGPDAIKRFWDKVYKEYGIIDIPNAPHVIFEDEQMAVLFLLKYGAGSA